MTKEFKTILGRFIAIDVPKEATGFKPVYSKLSTAMEYKIEDSPEPYYEVEFLFAGHQPIEIIGLARNLTEEQWKKIVDITSEKKIYPLYAFTTNPEKTFSATATESGQSLMQSLGMPIVNKYGPFKPCMLSTPLSWDSVSVEEDTKIWQAEEDKLCNPLILKIK